MNNKSTKIWVFLCIILILGVGYFFIIGDKNDEKITSFTPDIKIIEEKIIDGERIFIVEDKKTKQQIEVNENSYLKDGEYSYNYDNIQKDSIGTYISYSILRNVYEDGGWKRIENARSLKETLVFKTIEDDERYKYNIIDFNSTSITLIPILTEDTAPFKVNGEVIGVVNNKEQITFNNINVFDSIFTIGEHSTFFSITHVSGQGGNWYITGGNRGSLIFDNLANSMAGWRADNLIVRTNLNFSLMGLPIGIIPQIANITLFTIFSPDFQENYTITGKEGTFLDSTAPYPNNFTGWETGNIIYGGNNITNLINSSEIYGGNKINLSLTNEGIDLINTYSGIGDLKIFLLDEERDVETRGVPTLSHGIGLGDTFTTQPILYIEYILSAPPSTLNYTNLRFNSTNGLNYSSDDLYFSLIPYTNNTDTPIHINLSFFKNGIFNVTYHNIELANATYYQFKFNKENTTKNEIWYISANMSDIEYKINFTTENLTIRNSPPSIPNINYPVNNLFTVNYTINLSCYGSIDVEGDVIKYEFYIDNSNPPATLISNATNQSAQYNLQASNAHYWRCRANDGQEVSSYNDTRTINVDWRYIYDSTLTYNPIVIEGNLEIFKLNITYSNELINEISATLKYNESYYPTTKTDEGANKTVFKADIIIPTPIIDNQVNNFFFNISLLLNNGTLLSNSSYGATQTVNNIYLINCDATNTSSFLIMNFTFSDESKKNATGESLRINNTVEGYIEYSSVNGNTTKQLNIYYPNNITEFGICITPKNTNVLITNGEFSYSDIDELNYDKRFYYFRRNIIQNITNNYLLFSLPKSVAVPISFTIKSSIGDVVNNYIIEAYKHNIADNTYNLVAMGKTGLDGIALIYLKQGDTPYKFLVRDESGNYREPFEILASVVDKILDKTTYTIQLGTGFTLGDLIDYLSKVQTGLSFNNGTSTFIYSYNDTQSRTEKTVLRITKISSSSTQVLVDRTFIGNTALYTYTIGNETGVYMASVYLVDEDGNTQYILQSSKEIPKKDLSDIVGSEGLLATLFIFITYVFMATTNPIATLIFAIVALIFTFMLGIFDIGWVTLITFIILVGGIVLYKIKKD